MITVIIGEPRCGKSTLATKLAKRTGLPLVSTGKRAVLATDDFMGVPWEQVPERIIPLLEESDELILEGCQAARVLRRWFKANPENALRVREVYFLDRPFVQRSSGQNAMGKGIQTVWREVRPYLIHAGVPIHYGLPEHDGN